VAGSCEQGNGLLSFVEVGSRSFLRNWVNPLHGIIVEIMFSRDSIQGLLKFEPGLVAPQLTHSAVTVVLCIADP
jgi:hypothetical protein